MSFYTIKLCQSTVQWTASETQIKLEQIGKLHGKEAGWIRSDLSIGPSNWLLRLIWSVIAKHFSWMRAFFFQVDLVKSRAILQQLDIQISGNTPLKKIFFEAVSRFNTIAPKHALITGDMLVIQAINLHPAEALQTYGFKTIKQVLSYTQVFGKAITRLDLSASSFSKLGNKHLEQVAKDCPNLKSLSIRSGRIDDDGLRWVKSLRHLNTLTLSNCSKVSNIALSYFRELSNLKELGLYGCNKINYEGIQRLKGLDLEMLDLTSCHQITDRALEQIKDFTHLQRLYLIGCTKITDEGIKKLRSLIHLKHLHILGCSKITSFGHDALSGIPGLTIHDK